MQNYFKMNEFGGSFWNNLNSKRLGLKKFYTLFLSLLWHAFDIYRVCVLLSLTRFNR